MTRMLRTRTIPTNTDRPSNNAIQEIQLSRWVSDTAFFERIRAASSLCLRPCPRGRWNEKPSEDLSIDFQPKAPLVPVRGFCLLGTTGMRRPALIRILLLLSARETNRDFFNIAGSKKHALSPHHAARAQSRCGAEILPGRLGAERGSPRRQRQGEIHAGVSVRRRG